MGKPDFDIVILMGCQIDVTGEFPSLVLQRIDCHEGGMVVQEHNSFMLLFKVLIVPQLCHSLDITDEITIEAWAKDPPLIPSKKEENRNHNEELFVNETSLDRNIEEVYDNNSKLAISRTVTNISHLYNFMRPFESLSRFFLKQIRNKNNVKDKNFSSKTIETYD